MNLRRLIVVLGASPARFFSCERVVVKMRFLVTGIAVFVGIADVV